MKSKNIVWKPVVLCTMILFLGCKDDVEGADAGTSSPTQSACSSSCSKATSCDYYSSINACTNECMEEFTASEVGCIDNCSSSLECDEWMDCAEDCISWDVTISPVNDEYCEGYSGANECCQPDDPCDWGNDSACDCGGTCLWDAADCAE